MRWPESSCGDLSAQRRVLLLERLGRGHGAADARVQAQHRDLHEDDAEQADPDDRDPRAPADEAVEEAGVADADGAAREAQAERCGDRDGAAARGGHRGRAAGARRAARAARRAWGGRAPRRARRVGRRRRHASVTSSFRAARSRADRARGLAATSPGVGTTARRVSSSASGSRPQRTRAGRAGRCSPAPARRGSASRDGPQESGRLSLQIAHRHGAGPRPAGSAASICASSSLTAMRIAWKTRLAGWPPAKRAGTGTAATIVSTSSFVVSRRACARRAHDRPARSAGVALLAVVAEQAREPALVPVVDDIGGRQLLGRVHAHVQRRVVGVGEAALPRVDLHRGHAEVDVDEVDGDALLAQRGQRLGERRRG